MFAKDLDQLHVAADTSASQNQIAYSVLREQLCGLVLFAAIGFDAG